MTNYLTEAEDLIKKVNINTDLTEHNANHILLASASQLLVLLTSVAHLEVVSHIFNSMFIILIGGYSSIMIP